MATPPKKTRGRQKIPLERMAKESSRMVTYSKRKAGLLKKASELVTLCAVQALCIIFSPANKPSAYGHPTVEAIINRFMPEENNLPQNIRDSSETVQNESLLEVSQLKDQIDTLKKHAEELLGERKLKSEEAQQFLEPPESFSYSELKQIQAILITLKNNVHAHAHNLEAQANLSLNPGPSVLDGQNSQGQISFINPPNMVVRENYNPNPTLVPSQTLPTIGPKNLIPYQNTMPTNMGWNPIPGQTFQMGEGSSNPLALPFNPQSEYMGSNPIPGEYQMFTNFMGHGNLPLNPQGRYMGSDPIPSDPIPSDYETFQNLLMADRTLNSPAPPSNPQGGYMGINPIPGDYQTFRNLMGEGSSNPSNPPLNPPGGFGFGPEFDPGMN